MTTIKSRVIRSPRILWTPAQKDALSARYSDEKTETLAADLGIPVAKVYAMAARCGLKKSAAYLASPAAGRTNGRQGIGTRFQKGHITWNRGMKGIDLAGERGKATQFKKGAFPHNTQAIGSYRLSKDGTLQRKIGNAKGNNSKRWRGVHELVWIEANGSVPPKHICIFKPGMRTNVLEEITADKVECISLSENMKRNTYHNYPKEIAQAIQLRGALQRKINRREKDEQPAT